MASLVDRKTGREWLWQNPHLTMRLPVYGESYTENIDFGGWDEMFPSISPARLADGTDIPDHGDLVGLAAEVQAIDDHSFDTIWHVRSVPARFTRRITLQGASIQVDYSLESMHEQPIPYLWACHPLIALESGMSLEVPTQKWQSQATGETADLPMNLPSSAGSCIDIDDPELNTALSPFAQKIFTTKGAVSELKLNAPDGSALLVTWDIETLPYLGIWLNLRGWSGCGSAPYLNLGIEPTTAPHDDLLEAMKEDQQRQLAPGEIHRWSMRLSLKHRTI